MKKFKLIIGASCSGKSTLAREILNGDKNTVELNRDNIRFSLCNNGVRDWSKWRFNRNMEQLVTDIEVLIAKHAMASGKNIISSNTNLNHKTRNFWKEFCKINSYYYEEIPVQVEWEELVKRNAQREGGIPESILWSQYKRFMQQYGCIGEHKLSVYRENPMLENTVICDLDGTICDMAGVRKPYEWALVGKDKPRMEIIRALEGLAYVHGHVTFMSGRDGCCWNETYDWIVDNVTSDWPEWIDWELVMRTPNDNRKDDVVKYELFNQYIRGKFNVAAALDDRLRVIRLWELLEIPNIIQVGKYNNEF